MKKTILLTACFVFFAGILSVKAEGNPFKEENDQLTKLYAEKNKALQAEKVEALNKKIQKLKFRKQRHLLKLLRPYQDRINAIEAKKITLETQGKNTEKLGLEIEKIQKEVDVILNWYYIKNRE